MNLNQEIKLNLDKLEAKLLEQEHRPFRLVWNFFTRKRKFPKNDPRRKAVTKAIIWRLFVSPTTIAITLSGFLGYATLYFMNRQTELLDNQNKLIKEQTTLIDGSRRSSQMVLLNGLMKDINYELKINNNSLSKQLNTRIISLSHLIKPYKIFDYKKGNISPLISPERGQLFHLLMIYKKNGLNLSDSLFWDSDFKYSDLNNQWLENINASFCNLRYSSIDNTIFHGADFTDSDLRDSYIKDTGFIGANMSRVDLRNSKVIDSNLSETKLEKADLRGTEFIKMNLSTIKSLDSAWVKSSEWFNELRVDSLNNTGIDELKKRYKILPIYNNAMGIDIYTLISIK